MKVKQKDPRQQEGVHFSPSDEFTASPSKREADGMAAPDLLGELEPPVSPPPRSVEDDVTGVQRARLEKAKALSLKRKADSVASGRPPPKSHAATDQSHGSPDSTFGIEFEP